MGQISQAGSTRELLRLSATHSASLDHIHVANLWNKLGKQSDASGPSHREELRRLLLRTAELTGSCGARQLSTVAHGVAKCRLVELSLVTSALLTTVAEAAVPQLREFTPLHLAITAWAFATTGHAAPELLDAIAAAAVPRLCEFTPQNLANTVWAFATAGHTVRPSCSRRDRGGGGAAAVRVHAAGARQHGVGVRRRRPPRACALR
jgi:hypothetical protein